VLARDNKLPTASAFAEPTADKSRQLWIDRPRTFNRRQIQPEVLHQGRKEREAGGCLTGIDILAVFAIFA
jgi:hypothetical protein